MKSKYPYLILLVLFIFPFCGIMPRSVAQTWQWARGEAGTNTESWAVAADAAGNSYIAGNPIYTGVTMKFGSVTIPPITGAQAVWVKYDPNGNVLWADGNTAGSASIRYITTDPSGNLILFGEFFSPTMQIGSFTLTNTSTTGWAQYFVAKISTSGTPLWAVSGCNMHPVTPFRFLVFALSEGMGAVTTDAAGNVYITSSYNETSTTIGPYTLTNADPTGATYDMFVAKYSPAGALLWASSIGGNNNDYACGIAVSATTGNVFVSGAFMSPSITVGSSVITNPFTRTLACISEFSPAGAPLWAQAAGGTNGAFALGMAADKLGNVYMTGGFGGASISFGSTTVNRTYPVSTSNITLFLTKFAPSHAVAWGRTIEGKSSTVVGYGISMAPCGQLWLGGSYSEPVLIGAGDTLKMMDSAIDPVFIAGYDLAGNPIGYAGLNSGGDDEMGVACDGMGNVFVSSDYNVPLICGPDTLRAVRTREEIMYVAKYSNTVLTIPDTTTVDSTICLSIADIARGVTLTATAGYTYYYWDDGTENRTRKVTTPGKYYVYGISCGVAVQRQTFTIAVPDSSYGKKDTSACILKAPMTLYAPPGTGTMWSTGSTSSTIPVAADGTYWVRATKGCSTRFDTFHVTFTPVTLTSAVTDKGACASRGAITLPAPAGYSTVLWSTGSTATSVTVSAEGTYWVQGTAGCNMHTDTFHVSFIAEPVVALGNDTSFCVGDTVTLRSVQPKPYTLLWSTGSKTASIKTGTEGTYWLAVDNSGCVATDTITITAMYPPDAIHFGPDTTLCNEEMLKLSVQPGTAALQWYNGSKEEQVTITESGSYWAALSNTCGTTSDTIDVRIESCEIWIPTAFTPNGDNKNDLARVMFTSNKFKDFSLNIYNRFGERVFYTTDIYAGWDGTINGTPQDLGTYFYYIRYTLNGNKRMLKGDITLIR